MPKRRHNAKALDSDSLSKAYKHEPTLENYVLLRRGNPTAEIEVAVIGGMDQLFFMEKELNRFGLSVDLMAGVLDADEASINEIALQLMEKIIAARKLARSGQTQLSSRAMAVPDKLIDWIICCALDSLSWNGTLQIPRDLIVLIRERLVGSRPAYEQRNLAHQQKFDAAMIAAQLKMQGVSPTFRTLGAVLKVAPSTVKRWFAPGEFEREVGVWVRIFSDEKHGLHTLKKAALQRK